MTDKVVVRFMDGSIVKGSLMDFSETESELRIEEYPSGKVSTVRTEELKAVFFVKSFEGDPTHREIKNFSVSSTRRGRRVYVRFKDNESLLGYLEGETPWPRGFHLSKPGDGRKGFFLVPVDEECNNMKVFVVGSAVKDVTLM